MPGSSVRRASCPSCSPRPTRGSSRALRGRMSDGFADAGVTAACGYERAGGGFPVVFVHSGSDGCAGVEPQFEASSSTRSSATTVAAGVRTPCRDRSRTCGISEPRSTRSEITRCAIAGCAEGAGAGVHPRAETPEAIEAVVASSPRVSGYPGAIPALRRSARPGRPLDRGGRYARCDRAPACGLGPHNLEGRSRRADGGARTPPRSKFDLSWREGLRRRRSTAWMSPCRRVADRRRGREIAEVARSPDLVAAQVPGASKRVVAETDQLVNVRQARERFNRLALDFLAFAGWRARPMARMAKAASSSSTGRARVGVGGRAPTWSSRIRGCGTAAGCRGRAVRGCSRVPAGCSGSTSAATAARAARNAGRPYSHVRGCRGGDGRGRLPSAPRGSATRWAGRWRWTLALTHPAGVSALVLATPRISGFEGTQE